MLLTGDEKFGQWLLGSVHVTQKYTRLKKVEPAHKQAMQLISVGYQLSALYKISVRNIAYRFRYHQRYLTDIDRYFGRLG
ncbi:hypothetical protein Hanom_Chr15g01353581 [Helianthus anomalus]